MDEWWRGAVLYQIYPRSFADSNGDGIGDLRGATARLDYIASLGVDGIWLSPFFTSPMRDFGYDVADYRGVDPMFGTLADFDAFLAGAHQRGLKVIIDQIYSHSSIDHPWFTESRQDRSNDRADWYVWADSKPDGSPPNNWLSMFGGVAWTWDTRRRQYYMHNFLSTQPDLNVRNEAVQAEILDIARFWLERGVDGFRLDVCNYYMHDQLLRDNPPSATPDALKPYFRQRHLYDKSQPENLPFIERLRAVLDEHGDTLAVAEIASDHPIERVRDYTRGNSRLHSAYSFIFLGAPMTAAEFGAAVSRFLVEAPDAWPCWAFSNHDNQRVASRWLQGRDPTWWSRTLYALVTSMRGTSFVYQGEELGLPEADVPFESIVDPDGLAFWPAYKGRDGCRTPMAWQADAPNGGFSAARPWLPFDAAHAPLAVDRQEGDPESHLAFVRRWLAWRATQPAIKNGDMAVLDSVDDVLVFTRTCGEDQLIIMVNFGFEPRFQPWPNGVAVEAFALGGVAGADGVTLPVGAGFIGHCPVAAR